MKRIIIGTGKYSTVFLSYLREAGVEIVGIFDDNVSEWNQRIHCVPIWNPISMLYDLKYKLGVEAIYCPLDNNRLVVKLFMEAHSVGYTTISYMHHNVYILHNVKIDDASVYILDNMYIMSEVKSEKDVMISVWASIIHHSTPHRGVFVSNGINLGESLDVMDYAYIGMGITITTCVKTSSNDCLIGAVAVGVPTKVFKITPKCNWSTNSVLPSTVHIRSNLTNRQIYCKFVA